MKRWLFIIVALLALTGQANAQRYLPGMRGLELRGGFVDGVQKPLNYYTGIGLSTYTKCLFKHELLMFLKNTASGTTSAHC